MRSFFLVVAFAFLTGVFPASAQDSERENRPVDTLLAELQDADMDIRIEALRELQTSLDPRLPDAFLPLLSDEGNSIRRLAARGIGSRWWQISGERVSTFTKALAKNAGRDFEDEKNMVNRALGLLRRDYKGDMFARSANGRWVVYERRNLPCLIDTTTDSEELLGWDTDSAWLVSSWGNGVLTDAVRWHPSKDKELCVLSVLERRRASTLWVWRHGKEIQKLDPDDILKALGQPKAVVFTPGGFYADFKDWTPNGIAVDFSYTTEKDEAFTEQTAELDWNPDRDTWRVLSREATLQ
jgi:hypothetical protein